MSANQPPIIIQPPAAASGQVINVTPIIPVPMAPGQTAMRPPTAPVTILPSAPIAGVPSIFTQLGFATVPSMRRLFISGDGPTGSGKTRFVKTCPPPIGVVDFDKGMEGVAEQDMWGNPIVRKSLPTPDFTELGPEDRRGTSAPAVNDAERALATTTYEQFKIIMETLFKGLTGGTVAIDNGGKIYTCAMAARFGQLARLGDVPAAVWRMMKDEFESIFTMAYDYNVNLIVMHRQKAKWGSTTGEKDIDGYSDMKFSAQIHLTFDAKMVAPPMPSGQMIMPGAIVPRPELKFTAKVTKCRQNAAVINREFEAIWLDKENGVSMGLDFLTVARAVYPMSKDEDWIRR